MMAKSINLHHFVDIWEKILKKPDDLFFSKTIGNISDYLLEWTEERKSLEKKKPLNQRKKVEIKQNFYEYELLINLQGHINKLTVETRILSYCKPSLIKKLSPSLNPPIPVKPLQKYLKAVDEAYKSKRFLLGVKKIIFSALGDNNRTNEIDFAISYLLRSLLLSHSVEYLKDLPRATFFKYYIEIYKKAIAKKIIKSKPLVSEKKTFLISLIDTLIQESKNVKYDAELFSYKNSYWDRDFYFVLQNSRLYLQNSRTLHNRIREVKNISSVKSACELFSDKTIRKIFEKISSECIEKTCFIIILKCLYKFISTVEITNLSKYPYCEIISSIIKETIYENNVSEYETFNYRIAEKSFWKFLNVYSTQIANKIKGKILSHYTNDLILRFTTFTIQEYKRSPVNVNNAFNLENMLNRFSFNRLIADFMKDIASQNMQVILKFIEEYKSDKIYNIIAKNFEKGFLEIFFKSSSRYLFSKIPYDVSKHVAQKILEEFFKELSAKEMSYRVFFVIGDIDCQMKHHKIGDANFYDARTWEFGEGSVFDLFYESALTLGGEKLKTQFEKSYETFTENDKIHELKRNSARVFVDQKAVDQHMAVEQAIVTILEALDTLVFASSAGGERGFRPQLPNEYHVMLKDRQHAYHSSKRHPLTSDMLELTKEYDEIISFYNKLISNKGKQFNFPLLRALDWYKLGHWEITSHLKFIAYWIALEQLLRSEKWINLVPKLTTTWRKDDASYAIGIHLQGAISEAKKDSKLMTYIKKKITLEEWNKNNAVILENLDNLIENSTIARANLVALRDYMTKSRVKSIKYYVKIFRQYNKFKIYLLKAKRNSLVHEGSTYSTKLDLMAKELEKILISCIRSILAFREKENINQIIYEVNRPYQVRTD